MVMMVFFVQNKKSMHAHATANHYVAWHYAFMCLLNANWSQHSF